VNQEWRELLSHPDCRAVVSVVLENPYIEKSNLAEKSGLSAQAFENALNKLAEAIILLELASQADSSMESRVPKKIYLVNPEIENEVKGLLR
jgi:hypothetical protein